MKLRALFAMLPPSVRGPATHGLTAAVAIAAALGINSPAVEDCQLQILELREQMTALRSFVEGSIR